MSEDPLSQRFLWNAILILLNILFSLAWGAVEQAAVNKLKKASETEGGGMAKHLWKTVQQPEMFLTGMRLASLLVVMAMVAYSVRHFSPGLMEAIGNRTMLSLGLSRILADTLVLVAVLLVSLLFGDMLPRRIAALRPGIIRVVFVPAWVVALALTPFSWALTRVTAWMIRLLRIEHHEMEEVSEDEIRMMVDIGEVAGAIQAAEKEMIENVFEFNNMTAKDVMIHRKDMTVVWEEDSPEDIIHTIRETGLSRFPVCKEDVDDITGILTTRKYLLNYSLDEPKPLSEIIWDAYFVPESVRTDLLFREMQRKKVHMAIVVDEYGGTSGLVTMEDLLEQLVGDIYDEFDSEEEQEIIQLEPNLWRVSGSAELEVLCAELGIEIPEEEEFDTLGGMVFSQLSVIPDDGSHPEVEAYGLRIVVEQLQDRRVEWATVRKFQGEVTEEAE